MTQSVIHFRAGKETLFFVKKVHVKAFSAGQVVSREPIVKWTPAVTNVKEALLQKTTIEAQSVQSAVDRHN